MRTLLAATAVIGATLGIGRAVAAEKKLGIQDLPPAVQQTVKQQTRNATLVGLAKEVENGKTSPRTGPR